MLTPTLSKGFSGTRSLFNLGTGSGAELPDGGYPVRRAQWRYRSMEVIPLPNVARGEQPGRLYLRACLSSEKAGMIA